ncbi:MAG: hypothetical protein WB780_15405 [Candidatus Acidiferrales bacterium]
MTIWRVKKEVPTDLPSARLYLDDLEEIVRLFGDALTDAMKNVTDETERAKPIEKKFMVRNKNKICDEIQDLPNIAKSTRRFKLQVAKDWRTINLEMAWNGTRWTGPLLTDEVQWTVYRKLQEIFDARKLRLRSAFRAFFFDFMFGAFFFGIGWTLLVPFLDKLLRNVLPSGVALSLALLTAILIFIPVVWLTFAGSTIIFRHSSDHAALREDRLWKIMPALLTGIIGLLVGILIAYLKHRYWP